jgi:hypothetical protein
VEDIVILGRVILNFSSPAKTAVVPVEDTRIEGMGILTSFSLPPPVADTPRKAPPDTKEGRVISQVPDSLVTVADEAVMAGRVMETVPYT